MAKVDIDDKLVLLIKAEALKRGLTIKDFVSQVMEGSISEDARRFVGETVPTITKYKDTKRTKVKPVKTAPSALAEPKPSDKEITLKLLYEIKRLLEAGEEPTNREVVANIEGVGQAGSYLKPYGLETVNIRGGRRYLADHLPVVLEVIADLEKEIGNLEGGD